MQAVQILAPGRARLAEIETPSPGPGEVLIEVAADLHIYRGEYEGNYPIVPGHEFSGTMAAVGEGVSAVVPVTGSRSIPTFPVTAARPASATRPTSARSWRPSV